MAASCDTVTNRALLRGLPKPPETRTFKPVSHYVFAESVAGALRDAGYRVSSERYTLARDGGLLLGVLDLEAHSRAGDYHAQFGYRTGNTRHHAARAVAGARVVVCSNGMLSGEQEVMWERHTPGLDVEAAAFNAVASFSRRWQELNARIEGWKRDHLSPRECKEFLWDFFASTEAVPGAILPAVNGELVKPSYPEFATSGYTAWRLYNAFTTAARQIPNEIRRHEALGKWAKAFESAFAHDTLD